PDRRRHDRRPLVERPPRPGVLPHRLVPDQQRPPLLLPGGPGLVDGLLGRPERGPDPGQPEVLLLHPRLDRRPGDRLPGPLLTPPPAERPAGGPIRPPPPILPLTPPLEPFASAPPQAAA